jgi:hypothetical protein
MISLQAMSSLAEGIRHLKKNFFIKVDENHSFSPIEIHMMAKHLPNSWPKSISSHGFTDLLSL